MPHVSTAVEYGLHCLLFLVTDRGEARVASARDLADLQGVPAAYVAKLFTRLERAGIVSADEGIAGGYRLARAPADVSVLDVVHALDGDKPLFECREVRRGCALFGQTAPTWATRGRCSIHAVMVEADARMREALSAHTLAELVSNVSTKAPRSFPTQVGDWLQRRSASRRNSTTHQRKKAKGRTR